MKREGKLDRAEKKIISTGPGTTHSITVRRNIFLAF
jgi:hypothetical protein